MDALKLLRFEIFQWKTAGLAYPELVHPEAHNKNVLCRISRDLVLCYNLRFSSNTRGCMKKSLEPSVQFGSSVHYNAGT